MRPVLAFALVLLAAAAFAAPPPPVGELPVEKSDGDLKAVIQSLTLVPPPGGGDPTDLNENSWTRVGLKLDWGGRPTRDWALTQVELTDPRGLTYKPRRTSTYFNKEGEGEVRFSGPIWSTTEPWKVRLSFARTSSLPTYEFWKVFSESEILTVRGIPVPAPGQVIQDGRTAERQGVKVELLGYAGANAAIPDGVPFKYPNPTVQYRIHRPEGMHVTFLRATDAAGKVIPVGAQAQGYSPKGEHYARELKVPQGVREIYLAFAVHKDRVFEFTAQPSQ